MEIISRRASFTRGGPCVNRPGRRITLDEHVYLHVYLPRHVMAVNWK